VPKGTFEWELFEVEDPSPSWCFAPACIKSFLLRRAAGFAAQKKVDLYTINRIKNEAFLLAHGMENAFYLTDVYGPGLTGSQERK
jgi:hypothetical protein